MHDSALSEDVYLSSFTIISLELLSQEDIFASKLSLLGCLFPGNLDEKTICQQLFEDTSSNVKT